jgi:pimeloyl-ACP methyl ester carboxylesterase
MATIPSRDGTSIAYERVGGGPTLILVGGATQFRAVDPKQAEVARLLSDRFTIITYDRRGRGESGDTAPYAVAREIEDIAALIEAGGGSAFLFGHSSGALLALDAAAAGLPVAKLVLYEPPFIVDGSAAPRAPDFLDRLRTALARNDRDAAAEIFFGDVGLPPEMIAGMRQSPYWPAVTGLAPTLLYDATIIGDTRSGKPLAGGRWDTVLVPTLVADGDASFPNMRGAADALAHVLPDASRQTLAGQDHGPAPELLAPLIAGFLSA